ncbi:hypothetical protein E4191_10300 [Paracoccus liaowanqingii]|uniref:DUF3035 domain-containing protein n=1 Tax=Paracoccus liaowanqingii TaxID=2560053 RepID=A0A4P7HP70_9RHOB|nr:hypothetical protein [Paracoccus liaowanqingii]QBX35051.1 hypothetical protein E4191_10300 [Paracoccus liaowanqingii]
MRHASAALAPAALTLVLLIAACSEGGEFPALLPTDRLLAEPALPAHAVAARADPAPLEAATLARAEALQARAAALQRPVVDPALRARAGR